MSNEALKRYTAAPTKFDKAPLGARCTVLLNDAGTEQETYIQVSDDQDDIQWLPAKELLFKVYEDNLSDPAFLNDLLDMYRSIS